MVLAPADREEFLGLFVQALVGGVVVHPGRDVSDARAGMLSLGEITTAVEGALELVLGRRIAADDPFMTAGLDSLAVTEVMATLNARLAVDLPSTVVFDHPTTQALALHLFNRASKAEAGAVQRVSNEEHGDTLRIQMRKVVQDASGITFADDEPFMANGLDSLAMAEVHAALQHLTNDQLPATAVFDYPSIAALSDFIICGARNAACSPFVGARGIVDLGKPSPTDTSTRLVSWACRYAGRVDNCMGCLDVLAHPRDLLEVISRWDVEATYFPLPEAGKMDVRHGYFVEAVYEFDRDVFR